MAFNINEFKAIALRTGLLRSNKFMVRVMPPRGTNSPVGNNSRFLEFFCDSVYLPGIQIASSQNLRYGYGALEKMPVLPTYGDAFMTFYVDSGGDVWNFFKTWMNSIIPPEFDGISGNRNEYEVEYKQNYESQVIVYVFDQSGKPTIEITLHKAWPIFLGNIQLNWGDNNQLMRLPVAFTYRDWSSANKTSGAAMFPVAPTQNIIPNATNIPAITI